MADLTWHDSGNYHWVTWDENENNAYEYHFRLAANSYRDGGTKFNMFQTLPNVNAPSNSEKVVVLNGGIYYTYDGKVYNQGAEVAWYYNVLQEDFAQYSDDCLALGTWGSGLEFGTQSSMFGSYPLVLTGPSRRDGTGTEGVNASTAHSFVGRGNNTNYMGYCTGVTGAACVAKMTGIYGGTCMILDGGGSTQMWYKGNIVRQSTDSGGVRNIKNALALYRVKKSTPDPVMPTPGTGSPDNDKTGPVASKSFVYKDGILKPINSWSKVVNGVLRSNPSGIYEVVNGQLVPKLLKYKVIFNSNGGTHVDPIEYYYGDRVELPTPGHDRKDGLPCRFWGWFKDDALTEQVSNLASEATGTKIYKAKWLQYKMQYSGEYSKTEEGQLPLYDPDSAIRSAGKSYWCRAIAAKDMVVKYAFFNFDCCTSSWTNYAKPVVDLVVFSDTDFRSTDIARSINVQSPAYTQFGISEQHNWTGEFKINAGEQYGILCHGDTGSGRNMTVMVEAKMSGSIKTNVYADWQNSNIAPDGGIWEEDYPLKRYSKRHFDGVTWTDWYGD